MYLKSDMFCLPLRFIPDNVTFDDKPKDVASEVNIAAYKPKYFTSAAMGTSKVSLQWFCNVFLICLVLLSAHEWYVYWGKDSWLCLPFQNKDIKRIKRFKHAMDPQVATLVWILKEIWLLFYELNTEFWPLYISSASCTWNYFVIYS